MRWYIRDYIDCLTRKKQCDEGSMNVIRVELKKELDNMTPLYNEMQEKNIHFEDIESDYLEIKRALEITSTPTQLQLL